MSVQQSSGRWLPTPLPAVLVGLLAAAVSLVAVGTPSLWGDEVATIMSAQRSWPELWQLLGHMDAVHGAFYIVMHVWIEAFGASPFSVRLPSVLAVGIAAAGLVELVRRFGTIRLAVLAGTLFAVLPRTQYMGGEARSYAGSAAIAVWLTVVLVLATRASTRRARLWWWVGYAAVLVFGMVWFVYLALLLPAQLLWLLRSAESRAALRGWLPATGSAVLLTLPFGLLLLGQREQLSWIATSGVNGPVQLLVDPWFSSPWLAVLGWGLMLGLLVSVWMRRRRLLPDQLDPLIGLAASWALLPLGLLWLIGWVTPAFTARYLSMSTPAVAVLLAVAIIMLWRRFAVAGWIAAVLVVALVLPVLVQQRTANAKRTSDWSQLSQTVGEVARPGDCIVFDESGPPWVHPRLAMHGYPEGFRRVVDVLGDTLGLPADSVWDTEALTIEQADWLGKLDACRRIWVVEQLAAGVPNHTEITVLEGLGFTAEQRIRLPNSELQLLVRPAR